MLRIALQIFRLIPFPLLYVLSDALAFVLFKVLKYRRKVIFENLQRAFPEKNEQEMLRLVRAAYQNLTDVTLETLKSFTLSFTEIERRAICINPELVNQYLDQGKSVLLTGSHFGNWEYSGLSMPLKLHGTAVLVYKPLSNKSMDAFLNHARTRTGAATVAMDDLFRALRKSVPSAFVLLSDQSPSSRKSAHWVSFFGQDTAALPGADVLGRKFNMPVLYYLIQRTGKRGFYEIRFSEICPNPSEVAEMDITRAYTSKLEADILQQPEQWLWSHKRWKMTRTP